MFLKRTNLNCLALFWLIVLSASAAGQQQPIPVASQDQVENDRAIIADDFLKNRPGQPKPNRKKTSSTYRRATAATKRFNQVKLQIGVTIWKLESGTGASSTTQRSVSGGYWNNADWKRVEADAKFRKGDNLRISIESPRDGYLYVINRDLLADGNYGVTNLIFPTQGEDNWLRAGKLIDIPAQGDVPFKASPQPGQVSESLTIIVTSSPLRLRLGPKAIPISRKQLKEWEERWGGETDRLEMNGGAGQIRTQEEQLAADQMRSRQLTREDPMPQTIYSVVTKNTDGLLFNLDLLYATPSSASGRVSPLLHHSHFIEKARGSYASQQMASSSSVVTPVLDLIKSQKYNEAITQLEQILEREPQNGEARTYMATANLYRTRDFFKAQGEFKEAFNAGGGATFFVTHSHEMITTSDVVDYCRGWLHLRKDSVEFSPTEGSHGFRVQVAQVTEFGVNKLSKRAFHIKAGGKSQNFRGRTNTDLEPLLIVALYKSFKGM